MSVQALNEAFFLPVAGLCPAGSRTGCGGQKGCSWGCLGWSWRSRGGLGRSYKVGGLGVVSGVSWVVLGSLGVVLGGLGAVLSYTSICRVNLGLAGPSFRAGGGRGGGRRGGGGGGGREAHLKFWYFLFRYEVPA